ncbi:MAG: hypothetical protein JWL90_4551 [Chthoniobacteraceae bacterium]|nr:hypothetical protein [Chthoniobacteraceae bacterium]
MLAACCVSMAFSAEGSTWNTGSGFWSVGSNWTDGQVPLSGEETELTFNSSLSGGVASNDLNVVPFSLNLLTLESSGASPASINGNALRFAGESARITQNKSGGFAIGMELLIDVPTTLEGNGVGIVKLNGALKGASAIIKTGGSTFQFGSAFSASSSQNTFHGGVIIEQGTLSFANALVTGRTALRANRVAFESNEATLRSGSELRSGELSGSAGNVVAVDEEGTLQGQNILLYAYGDAEFGGSISTLPIITTGVSGALSIRGAATQTLSGAVLVDEAITIAHGASLELSGKATLRERLNVTFNLNGGALTLNNIAENDNDRIRDSRTENEGIDSVGGGIFSLVGNAAGTTETIGLLELGSRAEARSGAVTVNVTHNSGTTAATVLELFDLSRFSKDSPKTTVDFTAQDGTGKPVLLGRSGNNPRIQISTPPILSNGLLAPNDSGEIDESVTPPVPNGYIDHVGWATVNGSSFATYGPNGIAPVEAEPFTGESHDTHNELLAVDGLITSDERVSLNSLKLAPTKPGRKLTIAGKGNLRTNAILLAGENDYSIVNKDNAAELGGLIGQGGSRYIFVQKALLNLGVNLGAKAGVDPAQTDSVTKSGAGTLVLSSADNQYLLKSLTINEGTVRATPGSSLPGGQIELRGGVLEISDGIPFSVALGNDPGEINWRGNEKLADVTNKGESPKDKGSGGFSAFGADATVTISVKADPNLAWEEPYFIDSNHALIFGSTRADRCITFASGLTLLGSGAKTVNFNAREIRVIDNPNSNRDFARISGLIKGPIFADLLKTGEGALELTGENSEFQGGIVVAEGALLTDRSNGFGADSGAYILLGKRSGSASSALLASHHSGTVSIGRGISVQSGSTGEALIGNTIVSTMSDPSTSAGDTVFSGRINLGLTGCGVDRTLRLHAEANTNVTFSGGIVTVAGYLGVMDLELSGEGSVLLSGQNSYVGPTRITHGSLKSVSADALSPNSRIILSPGTSLTLNGFNQQAGSLEGAGTVDLGIGTLTTGTDDGTTLYGGLISGSGGLIKIGAGRFMLTGANSYSGETVVAGGILAIENASGSATGSGPLSVNAGGILEGTGIVTGSLAINTGGVLSPGDGVGKLITGSATYGAGGLYRWEMQDASARGGAGVDCHRVQGSIAITATAADPFVIDVTALGRGSNKVAHFSPTSDFTWVLATASGGITGFDPTLFQVRSEHFTAENPIGSGSFSVARRGNDLLLLFTGSPVGGAGVYNGLVTNSSPANANTGYFRVSTTKTGSFSGTLQFGGYSYVLRGKFDPAGDYIVTGLKSSGGPALSVKLHLDLVGNRIIGSVGEGETASLLLAKRAAYKSTAGSKPGAYTVLMPPDPVNSTADFPQGYGYAVMRVSPIGAVTLKGKLGDGTPFSLGTLLDNDGTFPFYVALYPNGSLPKGSIRGTVEFEEKSGISDFDGLLDWEKPAHPADRFYAKGFISRTHLIGSHYLPPQKAVRALNVPDGNAQFSLPDWPPIHILITPKNTVTVTDSPNSHSLKLILETKTGLFSGSFQNEAAARTLFQGVLFQKQRLGAGLFLGLDQSSFVRFGPP